MTSCNSWKKKVRQQIKKTGEIMGKSTQRQENNWENWLDKSYILCINYMENEPRRPVTAKALRPRKPVIMIVKDCQKQQNV